MTSEDAPALASAILLVPLPALVFVGTEVLAANPPAIDLLGLAIDDLSASLRRGLFDDRARARLDDLLNAAPTDTPSSTMLEWGRRAPLVTLRATLQRCDEHTSILMLVDESEAFRLDAILSAFNNAAFMTDDERRVTWMSRGMIEAYGAPYLLHADVLDRVHPGDRAAALDLLETAAAHPRRKVRSSMRVAHIDFPEIYWRIDVTTMGLEDDLAIGGSVSVFGPHANDGLADDSDAHQSEMRMNDVMPVGIIVGTPDGRCSYRNRLAVQQLGEIPIGQAAASWIERAAEDEREALRTAMKEADAGNRSDSVVASFPGLGGRSWFRIDFTPQLNERAEANGWVATLLDVTVEVDALAELHHAHENLRYLATHDSLTGLANRAAMLENIDAALARTRHEANGVAVLYCDLDHFKPVNDQFGHDAGDFVLRVVAKRLQQALRPSDSAGRFGGDEFVVLCESFDSRADVQAVANRIEVLMQEPIQLEDPVTDIKVGVTIGSAFAKQDENSDSLLARADVRMYEGKAGRGVTRHRT